jgi:hypothetical protein
MQREQAPRDRYTMRFVLFIGFALALAGGCSHPPAEEAIRSTIESMRTAAEARSAAGVLEGIAGDFTGNDGTIDRDGLARILKLEFLRSQSIGVSLGAIDVRLDQDRATATFEMTVSDTSRRWLPSGRETYSVISGWRRDGSRWVCYNARWSSS